MFKEYANTQRKEVIVLKQFETAIGPLLAGATAEGICLLEFTDKDRIEKQTNRLNKLFATTMQQGESPFFDLLEKQLTEYFEGKRKEFELPLVTPGSEFQQSVWQQLLTIPYGATRSYKQQAMALNKPEAVRAVANANGQNRIAIIIPCHRVIGDDGSLTGYGGGLERKKWLLDLESRVMGRPVHKDLSLF